MRFRSLQMAFLITALLFVRTPQVRAAEDFCDACFAWLSSWCGGNWLCECLPADCSDPNNRFCGCR